MGMWTEDERRFLAVLAWWTCVGAMTSVAIARTEPRPWVVQAPVVQGYARIAHERVPVRIVEVKPTPEPERPTTATERPTAAGPTARSTSGHAARRRDDASGGLARLRALGTHAIADRWTPSDDGGAADLVQAAAAGVAVEDRAGGPRSRVDAGAPSDVPEIGPLGGGDAAGTSLSATARTHERKHAAPDEGPGAWHGLDTAQQGDVRLCYERELKAHPDLAGRVELAVSRGAIRVVSNATGSAELEACIERAARSWTLPPEAVGARLPVVLVR